MYIIGWGPFPLRLEVFSFYITQDNIFLPLIEWNFYWYSVYSVINACVIRPVYAAIGQTLPHYQNAPTFHQNAPTFHQNVPTFYQNTPTFHQDARPHFLTKRPIFSKINHYKKIIICDSNVYKCLPAIRFCSNILFLLYYIFINLFIKIINSINDDCIKLNLYVSLIITIIICLYWCRWSLMSLITGKKVKKTQAKVLWKTNVQSQQKNFEKFKLW